MKHLAGRFPVPLANITKPKYEDTVAIDSRLARRWKRRNVTFESLKKRNDKSKQNIHHTDKVDCIIVDDDDNNDDVKVSDLNASSSQTDDVDAEYRMFLAQLKEDGYSYALEVLIDGKIQILVKYNEADDDPAHESTPETAKDTDRQTKECIEASHDFLSKIVVGSSAMDESYREFIMNLIVEGENIVYVDEFSNRIAYEDNGDFTNLVDSVILAADPLLNRNCASFIRTKLPGFAAEVEEELSIEAPAQRACSHYRDNLMAYLVRPYDAAEYRELMLEASIRRPLGRHRELRGRSKSYSSEFCSKSYLDHHKDFAEKIGLYENDHPKALNLLRGFFYWLKNLSHEGAFRPWSDDQCFTSESRDKKDVCYMDLEVVKEID